MFLNIETFTNHSKFNLFGYRIGWDIISEKGTIRAVCLFLDGHRELAIAVRDSSTN
jgi:hypothetical protein